ncbi:GL19783 [Drosophila persimilis]|uniref:GL19783 n=1 Tax=Drosophila persimilis TaxID=7234 RepID=B4GYL3_DROPE|nr:GL19783 [Drosophila persimilis]
MAKDMDIEVQQRDDDIGNAVNNKVQNGGECITNGMEWNEENGRERETETGTEWKATAKQWMDKDIRGALTVAVALALALGPLVLNR